MNSPRRLFCALVSIGILWTVDGFIEKAQAQASASSDKNVYVVVHVDTIPGTAGVGPVTSILKEFAADSKKDAGNVRFELLIQDGKPNHFVLFEVWQTKSAFEAHNAAEHTRRFREKLQPSLGSPFDERLHALAQ